MHSDRVSCTLIPVLCTGDFVTAILTAKTEKGTKKWVICSAYFPGDNSECPPHILSEIVAYCEEKGLQLILGGDVNAHHFAWGSTNVNSRGESLFNFITAQNLVIMNKGNIPTFVTKTRKEVLDITLCTNKVSSLIQNWHVSEEPSCSDHRQIVFDIHAPLIKQTYRNPRETNWQGYKISLQEALKNGIAPINQVEGIETAVDQINDAINASFLENCRLKTKQFKSCKTVWWNANLERMRTEVRRLFRKAKDNQNWNLYKEKLTQYNKEIRKAKRASWRKFCEEIIETPACSRIHRVLAKDQGIAKEIGFLKNNEGTYTKTAKESLELLTRAHFPSAIFIDEHTFPRSGSKRPKSEEWKMAAHITRPVKVRWAVKKFKPYKSPGVDGIYPVLLQMGLEELIPHLCKIFKACLAWGFVPRSWQEVRVTYIPKIGKVSDLTPKAYRPISLTSFLLKTLERLVDRFIRDEILEKSPLSIKQHAYQPGRSTDSALNELNRTISKSIEDKEIALATFMDIEGAFNNATTDSLVNAQARVGVPPFICRWIRECLSSRIITSTLGEGTIKAIAGGGCPQGGVLSPLLWATLVDELLVQLTQADFECLGYADDVVIIVKGRFASVVSDRMQQAINITEKWCKKEKLSINAQKTQIIPFTNKKKLQGIKPLSVGGIKVPLGSEVKYLGITFDQKLTWKAHISNIAKKATMALGRCRRMCGKNWGISPKMTLWLYSRVIRPMIIYGSVAWWPKTGQGTAIRTLSGIQRQACLSVTGAMSTTPTAALEAILSLPPLHIFIQGEARAVNYRLMNGPLQTSKQQSRRFREIENELKANQILGKPSDVITVKYNFIRKYNILIPGKDEWKRGVPIQAESAWYTDGSKNEFGVGAGIYGHRGRIKTSTCLSQDTTVFQAEIAAILLAVGEINKLQGEIRSIAIFTDSQAALKALQSTQVKSKLVWECVNALNQLAEYKKVTLVWIPGHEGHKGNEKADELAKQATSEPFIGPQPSFGIAKATAKRSIGTWMDKKSIEFWKNVPGQKQAKLFLDRPMPEITTEILNKNRETVRKITSMLTGHCKLKKHMNTIGLSEDNHCRFCDKEPETPYHILCKCQALCELRLKTVGKEFPEAKSYTEQSLTKLLHMLTRTKLMQVL